MVNGESSELLPKSSASSIVADENKTEDEFATYKRRWWVLFVFCLCNSNQSLLWNTWSPIANTVEAAFEWPLEFAALVLAVSAFSSTIMAFPCMYIIERSSKFFNIWLMNMQFIWLEILFVQLAFSMKILSSFAWSNLRNTDQLDSPILNCSLAFLSKLLLLLIFTSFLQTSLQFYICYSVL